MVGDDQFDLLAIDAATGISDCHLDRFYAALTVEVGIRAGHVGDETDLDDITRRSGIARHTEGRAQRSGQHSQFQHFLQNHLLIFLTLPCHDDRADSCIGLLSLMR